MKMILHILIILLIFICCNEGNNSSLNNLRKESKLTKEIELEISSPADSFYVFYNNCQLSNDKVLEREVGNKIVFHYYFKNTDYTNAIDEEYYEEIQFEINPLECKDTCVIDIFSDIKSEFNWGCFCEFPDSIEEKKNKGFVKLIKKNNNIWIVNLDIENEPLKKTKKINKEFHLYNPDYIIVSHDTINKYDRFRRKQGLWIKNEKGGLTQGSFNNNYFTGNITYLNQTDDSIFVKNVLFFDKGKIKKIIRFDK